MLLVWVSDRVVLAMAVAEDREEGGDGGSGMWMQDCGGSSNSAASGDTLSVCQQGTDSGSHRVSIFIIYVYMQSTGPSDTN